MEKANKSSSSSFTADLFGPKDSSSTSSAGFFGSIFAPPTSMVPGREPHPQHFNGYGNVKHETAKDYKSDQKSINQLKKEKKPSYNENGRAVDYNSSIYYGGQEVYSPHNFNKDGDQNENNSSGASRGNWWQGSLYY